MEKHRVRPAVPVSFQQVADGDAVRSQVSRILSSPEFQRSERLRRFLGYVVEEILAGRGGELKEYTIALAVFDRPNSYDPDVDSIVRVEARKLRFRLDQYYETVGCTAPVRIKLSKGSYVPLIEWCEVGAQFAICAAFKSRRSGPCVVREQTLMAQPVKPDSLAPAG